jgi:ABC-type transport system involved in multi-copper enzyme maturation permease subunit
MSVYQRNYKAYTGRLTPLWARVGVLVRYGLREAWASKITMGIMVVSLLPIVVSIVQIYLVNNPAARLLMLRGGNSRILDINPAFFLRILEMQCWMALVLSSWVAPRLISYDLSDNALPILLSHPISRFSYLGGKFIALFAVLSAITWVPCLVLFAYQSYSAQEAWAVANLSIAAGLLIGSVVWISLLSMLGLALSSWVKWRVVATGAIFAAVFVPAGVGGIFSAVLRTKWGLLLNLPVMMTELWQRLLGAPAVMHSRNELPNSAILFMLVLVCAGCVAILNARIRAREVVRG